MIQCFALISNKTVVMNPFCLNWSTDVYMMSHSIEEVYKWVNEYPETTIYKLEIDAENATKAIISVIKGDSCEVKATILEVVNVKKV